MKTLLFMICLLACCSSYATALAGPPPLPTVSTNIQAKITVPSTTVLISMPVKMTVQASAPALILGSADLASWMGFGTTGTNDALQVVDGSALEFFRGVATNEPIAVDWTPSTSPTVIGYNIYAGTHSRVYNQTNAVGLVTNCVEIVRLVAGTNYLCCTAVGPGGQESPFSPELAYVTPSLKLTVTQTR